MSSTIKIVLSIVLSAVIVGSGTYYLVNNRANSEKATLQDQITALNTKATPEATTPTVTTPSPTTTTKTSDPTATWKTYTNTTNAYSVKYPADWKVVLDGNDKSLSIGSPTYVKALAAYKTANPNGGYNPPHEEFVLNYYKNLDALQCDPSGCPSPKPTTLDALVKQGNGTINAGAIANPLATEATKTTIGTMTFYKATGNDASRSYYTEINGHIYVLSFYTSNLTDDESNILKSFKSPL